MTKEQVLRYLHHEPGAEVPDVRLLDMMGGSEILKVLDVPVRERPMKGDGYDVFGVHWTGMSPASHYTPGQKPVMDDIEKWREQVRFPLVDRFDWDYVAAQSEKLDRENKVIISTLAASYLCFFYKSILCK